MLRPIPGYLDFMSGFLKPERGGLDVDHGNSSLALVLYPRLRR